MSIVSLLILILFFIICIFVKFYTIQPSSCNSITNKLSIYLSISHKYVNYDDPGESSPEKDCLG